ncbi:MAG: Sec-independent protein translocase protein TatC [Phycisphaerae bacterium]|nr:Sec-independent protein translocase protein TatC [Phycisphaerae bacterium]
MNLRQLFRRRLPHPDDVRMSLGDHLDELRTRMLLAVGGFIVGFVLCLIWSQELLSFLMRPAILVLRKYHQEPTLISLSPPDSFMMYLKLAALSGAIIASPWILWQIWQFVAAGLYDRERRYVRLAFLPSIVLFFTGATFMYLIVLPVTINFFTSFNMNFRPPGERMFFWEKILLGQPEPLPTTTQPAPTLIPLRRDDPTDAVPGSFWYDERQGQLKVIDQNGHLRIIPTRLQEHISTVTNQYSLQAYVAFVLELALAFGVAFQLPVVVVVLALIDLVTVQQMAQARRYIIFGIVVAAAVLTPQPDVFSQMLLALPMILLFEMGMLVARSMTRA